MGAELHLEVSVLFSCVSEAVTSVFGFVSLCGSLPLFRDSCWKGFVVFWRWRLRSGHSGSAVMAGILLTETKPNSGRVEGALVISRPSPVLCCSQHESW